jgi:hypothetical protein
MHLFKMQSYLLKRHKGMSQYKYPAGFSLYQYTNIYVEIARAN